MPTAVFNLPIYTGTDTAALDTLLNGQSNALETALLANVWRFTGLDAARTTLTAPRLKEGIEWYSTDTNTEWVYDGTRWLLKFGVESFTWSRANVDNTPQYPQLVDDAANTTDSGLASFQRVSGADPDGVGGVKIAYPGNYHISVGLSLAAAATGRSFIQIGADADIHRMRASVFSGEDYLAVTQVYRTTTVDQVVPIWFYKQNGNLSGNTGRVLVRRLG